MGNNLTCSTYLHKENSLTATQDMSLGWLSLNVIYESADFILIGTDCSNEAENTTPISVPLGGGSTNCVST